MKKKKTPIKILIGLITGFTNGFLGAGGGSILVPSLIYVTKVDRKKAHATALLVIAPLTAVSSINYIKNGFFDSSIVIPTGIGCIIGGFIGSSILCKISGRLLKAIFGLLMVSASLSILF